MLSTGLGLLDMSERTDVLGMGCVAVDDLLYVDRYPPADAKAEVRRRDRQCGGNTATALVAASRLGARAAYAGIIGDDELSAFVRERLVAAGVDLSPAVSRPGSRTIHATVVISDADGTRTIFFSLEGVGILRPGEVDADRVRSSRVLLVDHIAAEAMVRAARVAREAGIPVVADAEYHSTEAHIELLSLSDHLVLSRGYALELTGKTNVADALHSLWRADRAAVVITAGAEGCWAHDGGAGIHHQPAFPVDAVDTTGCGDVFHGAYAFALARGMDLPDRLRLASATAAIKATRPGGQAGIPDRAEVDGFLRGS